MTPLQKRIIKCIELIKEATAGLRPTLTASLIKDFGRDPYIILISCLLSLRARDTMTYPVSKALFARAKTPQELLQIDQKELEELFYPLGFYRVKAQRVKEVSQELIKRFGGNVPQTEEELLTIKGIGRKTANLVLGAAFEKPAICVDTHVHRLANRLGWVETKTPAQTEVALKHVVPKEYWLQVNNYLVLWGQNICVPISPLCSRCVLNPLCPKVGVAKRR